MWCGLLLPRGPDASSERHCDQKAGSNSSSDRSSVTVGTIFALVRLRLGLDRGPLIGGMLGRASFGATPVALGLKRIRLQGNGRCGIGVGHPTTPVISREHDGDRLHHRLRQLRRASTIDSRCGSHVRLPHTPQELFGVREHPGQGHRPGDAGQI